MVILIFLGQQAGSVWAGTKFSGHSHSLSSVVGDAMSGHCEGSEAAHHTEKTGLLSGPEAADSCDLECECCAGHCQSTLALLLPNLNLYQSNHSRFPAASQSIRTTNQSHFRPPIFA